MILSMSLQSRMPLYSLIHRKIDLTVLELNWGQYSISCLWLELPTRLESVCTFHQNGRNGKHWSVNNVHWQKECFSADFPRSWESQRTMCLSSRGWALSLIAFCLPPHWRLVCVRESISLFPKSKMHHNSMFTGWFTVELLVVQLKTLFCRLKILTEFLLQSNSNITFTLTLQKSKRTSFNKRSCPRARLFPPAWIRRERLEYVLYLLYCLIPRI